jgi:hypothetical protein
MVRRRCVVRRCLQMVFARRVLLFRHESSSCERGKMIESLGLPSVPRHIGQRANIVPETKINEATSSTTKAIATKIAKARTIAKGTKRPSQPRTMTSRTKTGKLGGSGPRKGTEESGLPSPGPPEPQRLRLLPTRQVSKYMEPIGSKPTKTRPPIPGSWSQSFSAKQTCAPSLSCGGELLARQPGAAIACTFP